MNNLECPYCERELEEISRLRAYTTELENIINAPYHVAVFDDVGWALEHSMECRLSGTMTKCIYNSALDRYCRSVDDPQFLIEQGRWVLTGINDNGLGFPTMRPE